MKEKQIFKIRAIPKPRMTKSDKWKKRPVVQKYWAFKDTLNILAKKDKFKLPTRFCIEFYLEVPKYWSKKRKIDMVGKPHQVKPDIDNLLKAFMDALEDEDMDVWNVHAKKYWSDEDKIIVKYEK